MAMTISKVTFRDRYIAVHTIAELYTFFPTIRVGADKVLTVLCIRGNTEMSVLVCFRKTEKGDKPMVRSGDM